MAANVAKFSSRSRGCARSETSTASSQAGSRRSRSSASTWSTPRPADPVTRLRSPGPAGDAGSVSAGPGGPPALRTRRRAPSRDRCCCGRRARTSWGGDSGSAKSGPAAAAGPPRVTFTPLVGARLLLATGDITVHPGQPDAAGASLVGSRLGLRRRLAARGTPQSLLRAHLQVGRRHGGRWQQEPRSAAKRPPRRTLWPAQDGGSRPHARLLGWRACRTISHPPPLPSRRGGAIGVDWLLGLPMMASGFAINNAASTLGGDLTPFLIGRGQHPRQPMSLPDLRAAGEPPAACAT